MRYRTQKYKTFFAIPKVHEGIAGWSNFKQIEDWGKSHGYDSFRKNKKLYLVNDSQIIVYEMQPKPCPKKGESI